MEESVGNSGSVFPVLLSSVTEVSYERILLSHRRNRSCFSSLSAALDLEPRAVGMLDSVQLTRATAPLQL